MKITFRKVKTNSQLGDVNFLGRPIVKTRSVSVKFKKAPKIKGYHGINMYSSISIPKKSSVSIFTPSMKRPAAAFYGDIDGDGVMNGLDCQPRNKYKQGKEHEQASANITKVLSELETRPKRQKYNYNKNYEVENKMRAENMEEWDKDEEGENFESSTNDWLKNKQDKRFIEEKKIQDFGINFNLKSREKAKSTKSDYTQSLIDSI